MTRIVTRHVLAGLRPEPLGSYLAGLGLIRVLGEQVDPDAIAAWVNDELVIESSVDDVAGWLVDDYVPTPVVSPWNEGSGFGVKDVTPKQRLDALRSSTSPRLENFRSTAAVADRVGAAYRANGWSKDRAVREFRNTCPDAVLPWIDATVVLADQQAFFPPILGTGGNDGRLDFSTTFHQRLLDVLDIRPADRRRSLAWARDLLGGTETEVLDGASAGQFDPVGAGGRNSSPFGSAESLINPWAFVLLIEGALLFAAGAVRRHQHAAGRAAIPFTVFASPNGSASGAVAESSRGEVWVPLWRRPQTTVEIRQVFTEARASWQGRPAQRAVEFYAATRTLGVARGIEAFVRYGLHQRNGLAFVAVPIERVQVVDRPEVRLAAKLEKWVSWVRGTEVSGAVAAAVRRFDEAHLAYVRNAGPRALAGLLAALTGVELAVGRSGRARDALAVRTAPQADDFLPVLADAECPELRVAIGIASCTTQARPNPTTATGRGMRELLLPVDPEPGRRWRDAPLVPGLGMRLLRQVLADVLIWRARNLDSQPPAGGTSVRGVTTFPGGIPVPAADLHAFAQGLLDDRAVEEWLLACLALRWDRIMHTWRQPPAATLLVPTLGVLHPLAAGLATPLTGQDMPALGLASDWPVRLAADQVIPVHQDAVRRLRQAGWHGVTAPPLSRVDKSHSSMVEGVSIAAALVPRCLKPMNLLKRHFAIPLRSEKPTEVSKELS